MDDEYIEEYEKILKGERKRFSSKFWDNNGEYKAKILFKYLFEEILKWDLDNIIKEFNEDTIKQYKLVTPFNKIYGKARGKIVKSVYPNAFDGRYIPISPEKKERILKGVRENRYTKEYAKKLSDTKLGEINPQHKLKTEQVIEIKELWKLGTYTTSSLGDKFGVKRQTIADIVYGRTWKHL